MGEVNVLTNITFLLGNGFDINLGLKTQYSDVYEEYIKTNPSSEVVSKFIASLKQDKTSKYKLWSDFEIGMGQYAKELESEDAFIECIRHFKAFMVKYLQDEQNRYVKQWEDKRSYLLKCVEFFENSVRNYSANLTPNSKRKVNSVCSTFPYNYNFLSFNYTSILDVFIQVYNEWKKDEQKQYVFKNPIHIHGRLNGDVLLGVDNEEQICNKFQLTTRGRRAFVKPQINSDYDEGRVVDAMKVIASSDVICVYGLSFGESDLTWIKAIAKWLQDNPEHQLVYCRYDTREYPRFDVELLLSTEDNWKIELIKKLQIPDEHKAAASRQIHIPVGTNMFGNRPVLQEVRGAQVAHPPATVY